MKRTSEQNCQYKGIPNRGPKFLRLLYITDQKPENSQKHVLKEHSNNLAVGEHFTNKQIKGQKMLILGYLIVLNFRGNSFSRFSRFCSNPRK